MSAVSPFRAGNRQGKKRLRYEASVTEEKIVQVVFKPRNRRNERLLLIDSITIRKVVHQEDKRENRKPLS